MNEEEKEQIKKEIEEEMNKKKKKHRFLKGFLFGAGATILGNVMKISIIGLGYVGLTSALCFQRLGHEVIGVDMNPNKVSLINEEISPINGYTIPLDMRFKATSNIKEAILNSEISFICVQTPTTKGKLDLSYLKKACKQIGEAIKKKKHHLIVVRSTIFPGSYEILKKIIEKSSEKKCGKGFDMALNPEFLREKTAIKDFFNPSYVVVGAETKEIGLNVLECYKGIDAKKFIVKLEVAQMIKYLNNSWHALKISYTNEIGRICEELKIDGDKLMALFCADKKLNISEKYHKIGSPFSGSCLPKDLAVLQNNINKLKLNCPIIQSISKSNEEHKRKWKK